MCNNRINCQKDDRFLLFMKRKTNKPLCIVMEKRGIFSKKCKINDKWNYHQVVLVLKPLYPTFYLPLIIVSKWIFEDRNFTLIKRVVDSI